MNIIKRINNRIELDLLALVKTLLRKAWFVVLISVLCGGMYTAYTYFFVAPQYEARISLYITNSNRPTDINNITSSDLSASYMLLQSYATIIQSESVLDGILKLSGVEYSTEELALMMTLDAPQNTPVLLVNITNSNPEVAALLANAAAEYAASNLSQIISGSSVRVLDYAKVPTKKTSPSYSKVLVFGGAAGFIVSVCIVILLSLRKRRIKSDKDFKNFKYPVLGWIRIRKSHDARDESYNELKNNLFYSLPGKKCKCLAVTSSTPEEKKSELSLRLSQSLADSGSRVLLLDSDIRHSDMEKILEVPLSPGFTEILIGAADIWDAVHSYSDNLDILPCGRHSMNPVSLLKSGEVEAALKTLEEKYDFIIMNAPAAADQEDAVLMYRAVLGVIYTVQVKKSWCQDVEEDLKIIESCGANLLGLAVIE